MYQSWDSLTFLHWKYPASAVQPLIPAGLELELYDGAAWVGLVPFVLRGVRVEGLPRLPGFGAFPETNVRTYVRGPDGVTGVWFFSLDAARLTAVIGARTGFGLPYFWAKMNVNVQPGVVAYASRRIWPGPPAAMSAEIEPGEQIPPERLTSFDHYLTARFRLISVRRGACVSSRVEHAPWPLRRARLLRLEQNLVEAAGLPAPAGPPVIHYSEGVAVRVGAVERVQPKVRG